MICLYRYEILPGEKVESIPYLRRAVSEYLMEQAGNERQNGSQKDKEEKQNLLLSVQIENNEKGKPQVKGTGLLQDAESEQFPWKGPDGAVPLSELHISATHTKNLIVCAVSLENVGIDGEFPEERREGISYERIASRFFTEREFQYVKESGAKGFFEIWVRKEAYMKYTGAGMAYGFKNIETRGMTGFLETIHGCRMLFEKRDGLYFACAGGRTDLVWK